MIKSVNSISKKAGMAPGSLIHVGEPMQPESNIRLINYSEENIEEKQIQSFDEIVKYKESDSVTWVMIEGLPTIDMMTQIGKDFGIHPLVLEDILNTQHRPKFEAYDNYLHIVLKSLQSEDEQFNMTYEQITLLVLNNFVFTFKEKTDDLFQPIIDRIKTDRGHFRSLGSDYLAYAILDTVVDQYFILIDSLDKAVTSLEDTFLNSQSKEETPGTIRNIKKEIITIRKNISPVRELTAEMLHSESELILDKTHIYLKDVSDHATHIIDTIESYSDVLSDLLDIHATDVSYQMNDVMQILALYSTIFIPLTFISGIYGMNFENIPELTWGYPAIWAVFIAIPAGMIFYFKKKKWL